MNFRFTLSFVFAILFQIGFTVDAEAQDARFSQFYAAPSQLNPAMTGVFEGKWRFHANYREQWNSILETNPFRTIAAGYDMRFRIVGSDYLAIGLNVMQDEAGQSHFNTKKVGLSAAYLKQVGGGGYRTADQYLVAAGSFGFGQNSIENRLWFSEQYRISTGFPNPDLDSGESFDMDGNLSTDVYMDVNAGILYYALFGDNTSVYGGVAMNHLSEPNVSFVGDNDVKIYRRWIVHGGAEIPFTPELSLMPAFQAMGQGPSFETNFGANFRYSNHDWRELAIRAGLWTRVVKTVSGSDVDALIVAAILEVERFNFGVSYDMTTSSLNVANNSRGAFELSVIYTHPTRERVKVKCPKL